MLSEDIADGTKWKSEETEERIGGIGMKKTFLIKVLFIIIGFLCLFMPITVHIFSPRIYSEITADGLLGYMIQTISAIGTISLAYVAIWQNKKMQSENDKAQNRMESLAVQANNINTVAKIIEYEQDNYFNLRNALDDFSDACNLQGLVNQLTDSLSSNFIGKITLKADDSFFALARELRIKPELLKEDKSPLNKAIAAYYGFVKEFVTNYESITIEELAEWIKCFEKIRLEFYTERENYLVEQETKLNKLIYGNLSIYEIKDMYRYYEKREENNNG